nr:YciI family protein [Kibdelosporangium sp. MJ126-NF4]CEL20311.1 DGPFAETKE family protein [Kibdelosporangium sp. MJ126-NF4]CTQ97537.1 DGPFAETKE family protein [Kibdelosporangium sp. MJ126-NF4]
MKYMIMLMGSQRDYDMLTGNGPADRQSWTLDEVQALHKFMGDWNNALVESGEFVDARGLSAPAHTRRLSSKDGVPVVTDGPYPETQEVLAGYTIVECESLDRATEIAASLIDTPHPEHVDLDRAWYVDIRPIDEHAPEPEA